MKFRAKSKVCSRVPQRQKLRAVPAPQGAPYCPASNVASAPRPVSPLPQRFHARPVRCCPPPDSPPARPVPLFLLHTWRYPRLRGAPPRQPFPQLPGRAPQLLRHHAQTDSFHAPLRRSQRCSHPRCSPSAALPRCSQPCSHPQCSPSAALPRCSQPCSHPRCSPSAALPRCSQPCSHLRCSLSAALPRCSQPCSHPRCSLSAALPRCSQRCSHPQCSPSAALPRCSQPCSHPRCSPAQTPASPRSSGRTLPRVQFLCRNSDNTSFPPLSSFKAMSTGS